MNKTIITLTGPSCSGKSTLEKMLKQRGFASVISTTTREPRAGEISGESYYFVTLEMFDAMSKDGDFAESVEFNGNRYGVTIAELERVFATGKPVVAVVEPDGRRQLEEAAKREGWNLHRVFVNVEPKVQAERFLSRFANEAVEGLGIDSKTVDVYANRLAVMMTTERAWVAGAYLNDRYDMLIKAFDEHSEDEVVAILCSIAGIREEVAA